MSEPNSASNSSPSNKALLMSLKNPVDQQVHPLQQNEDDDDDEQCALQVMGLIQQFINFLRDSFLVTTTKPNNQSRLASSSSSSLQSPQQLFTKICDETNLATQIQQLRLKRRRRRRQPPGEGDTGVNNEDDDKLYNFENYNQEDERLCMIYQIVLPLIDLLFEYCQVLDDKEEDEKRNHHHHKETTSSLPRKNKSSAAPPPTPSFLLSLQNYTDVAALMEVWVCWSLLIHVEPNILLSIQDRCRLALAKSLQGRLPRPCLLWATEYFSHYKQQEEQQPAPATSIAQQDQQQQQQVVMELHYGIVSVTRLLLLDRFRPMLLPRHVTDLYAAIAQADEYEKRLRCKHSKPLEELDNAYIDACTQLGLGRNVPTATTITTRDNINTNSSSSSSSNGKASNSSPPTTVLVNPTLQARTCQTLLRQGTKTPSWLRQRLTLLLSHLACHHMSALIQVFVVEAATATNSPSEDVLIGASLRLAHAVLLAMSSSSSSNKDDDHSSQGKRTNSNQCNNDLRAQQVCQQLLLCLSTVDENIWNMFTNANDCDDKSLSRHVVAYIRTIQAVLEQMPDAMLRRYFLPRLWDFPNSINQNEDRSITYSNRSSHLLRRLGALLSLPRHDFARLARIFFLPLPQKGVYLSSSQSQPQSTGPPSTLLSRLLALSSQVAKVEVVDDGSTKVREDAKTVLRMLTQAMAQSTFSHETSHVQGTDVMCVALVHAVATHAYGDDDIPTNQDLDQQEQLQQRLGNLGITSLENDRMVHDMQQRAQWVISNLVAAPGVESSRVTHMDSSIDGLPPSRFFQWLLWLYFWSSSSAGASRDNPQVQLAVMMLLPLLCEQVPPESLLLKTVDGKEQEEEAILPMIKLILAACAAHTNSDGASLSSKAETQTMVPDTSFVAAQGVFQRLTCENIYTETTNLNTANNSISIVPNETPETLLSICSIVLSLLVAMLELGVDHRPREQEELLKSLMPLLERLATIAEPTIRSASSNATIENDDDDDAVTDNLASNAEIAEMASHAMVLIASRDAKNNNNNILDDGTTNIREVSSETSWETILNQAQLDLASDQPPIRARSIVALRHFIRGGYFANHAAVTVRQVKVQIVESTNESEVSDAAIMIDGVLRLCLVALSDSESFVYLASIQTIVAAADVNPQLVLPKLAQALCTGNVALVDSKESATSADSRENKEILLTVEQRIKVAEALLFTIRRRASVYEYIPMLMGYLVYGTNKALLKRDASGDKTAVPGRLIEMQAATHDYFVRGNVDDDGDDIEPTSQERMEAQSIRVATGGPLFDTEENDIVRASCIQVVADLITASLPAVMAKYCPLLVDLATNALSLDASRPVRRAAALLSRELYDAVQREFHDIAASRTQSGRMPKVTRLMSIELVSSGEDKLLQALKYSVNINSQQFGFDPATVARCQEALALQEECEQSGILAAAKMVVAARRQDSKNPIARILKERLQEGTESDIIRLMLGHEIDTETLTLQL